MNQTLIKNEAELQKFAADFAMQLKGGEIIGLVGELGAGKTTFTKYLAQAFGVVRDVKSPTFIVMQVFNTTNNNIKHLVHIDAYRINNYEEFKAIGFLDYVNQSDSIIIVEWANLIPELKKFPNYLEINFGFGKGEERVLETST